MQFDVVFSPEARDDLKGLYVFIAERSGEESFVDAFQRSRSVGCAVMICLGLRVIGFERRASIAFHVDATSVVIDRILYGGQNLSAAFDRP